MFVAVVLFATVGFAQDFAKAGVIEVGGNVGFSSSTDVTAGETTDQSLTAITISPTVGYFVIDGLELGLDPLEFSTLSDGDNTLTSMGFWGFGTYHFSTGGMAFPYIQALVGYTSAKMTDMDATTGLSYGFAAGAKLKIAGGLLLNAGASYKFYTYNPSGADSRNGSNVLAIGVGLSGFFGK
jgi:outer membrane protein